MSDELVPVFIPPLAVLLAAAEQRQGRALTEAEALEIRDGAVCMMLQRADAHALSAQRGYRDVEPEDCWADWHRLRAQHTGGILPKLVLCAVGSERFAARAVELLTAEGVDHEVAGADPRMPRAFAASVHRGDASFHADDERAVAEHTRVVYVLSSNFTAAEAIPTARRLLALGARLLELEPETALKCESSGITHGRARWLELARAGDDTHIPLLAAFVQYPIGDERELWSCGMHLLGRPDLIVELAAFPATQRHAAEAYRLFFAFAAYLLDECGDQRHFSAGHTFRCDLESPRFQVGFERCTTYVEEDLFWNPFGRFRFHSEAT